MNSNCCCEFASRNAEGKTVSAKRTNSAQKPPELQRGLSITGWVLPSVILAILPKCPICLAGYVAIGTGISLSITTATYLRISLIILCIASPLYLVTKRLLRLRYHR